jgi:hypothetical protein
MESKKFIEKYGLTKDGVVAAFDRSDSYAEAASILNLRFAYQARRARREFSLDEFIFGRDPSGSKSSSEIRVASLLRRHGFAVTYTNHNCPYDLLVNETARVEVKCASYRPLAGREDDLGWSFNIHRHGIVAEGQVDAYILRLEEAPFGMGAIHLVFPSPIGKPTVGISLRSLLTRYAKYYNAFSNIPVAVRDQYSTSDDSKGLSVSA